MSTPQGLNLQQQLAAYFTLINNQSDLNPEFRADTSSCPTIDERIFGAPSATSGAGGQARKMEDQPSDDSDHYDDGGGDDYCGESC